MTSQETGSDVGGGGGTERRDQWHKSEEEGDEEAALEQRRVDGGDERKLRYPESSAAPGQQSIMGAGVTSSSELRLV